MPVFTTRETPPDIAHRLVAQGANPLLARLHAARGIASADETRVDLARLEAPERMRNLGIMAELLADAIDRRRRLLIVADYDADGATGCAVGLRALRLFGAEVDYLVPDRFRYGYGLTPEIVELAIATRRPDILITVDNGIASVEGVSAANRLGLPVLITDHHLPGDAMPRAACIVNPNQPGCSFASKHIAGVGVMFYLMLALRAELRRRGAFGTVPDAECGVLNENLDDSSPIIRHSAPTRVEPNLASLLDLVALGTVADVVKLDANNRVLVSQGLKRMREGRLQPGIAALFQVAGRDSRRASAHDLGYALGPRLNAAGRLADMALGIECLTTDDPQRATAIALELDRLNRERRTIEADMQEAALEAVAKVSPGGRYSLCLFNPQWHQGVIGIVASRIRERFHRPTVAFARAGNDELRGSGRSIGALHLRDALDRVAKRHPDLVLRFGGHAAAAGLTLRERDFGRFAEAFEAVAGDALTPADLEEEIVTDGSLALRDITLDNAELVKAQLWGHGFPEPLFLDRFDVVRQRVVGERHLRLRLAREHREFDAILFGSAERLPARIEAAYRLEVNEFNGARSVQLVLHHCVPRPA